VRDMLRPKGLQEYVACIEQRVDVAALVAATEFRRAGQRPPPMIRNSGNHLAGTTKAGGGSRLTDALVCNITVGCIVPFGGHLHEISKFAEVSRSGGIHAIAVMCS